MIYISPLVVGDVSFFISLRKLNLMGIQVVKAHEIPSDWWSVPVAGGAPTRLTQLQTIRLFVSISPDKKHIASLSGEGIFVMDQQGSNLTQLLLDPGVSGTVNWIS